MVEGLAIAGLSGVISGLVSFVAMRADMVWIKRIIHHHDKRITYLERKP